MTIKELYSIKKKYVEKIEYSFCYYKDFDFSILDNIIYRKKFSQHNNTFNDCIIMLDTETSKKQYEEEQVYIFDSEYNTIRNELKNITFLPDDNYFTYRNRKELYKIGLRFSKYGSSFDSWFYDLEKRYPHIFEYQNEYDNFNQVADFLFEYANPEEPDEKIFHNHIVIWTLSIRAFNHDIVTLYGRKPSECVECLNMINEKLKGQETYIYIHNMSYDWWFLRKFFINAWGDPEYQLNTKPHYPIMINFENGLMFRDSLILSQCSLEKWAKQLNIEIEKQVGLWDYEKTRNQDTELTEDELKYCEYDTLVGVRCLDMMCKQLDCNISMLPHTSTGIIRRDLKRLANKNNQRELFLRIVPTFEQYAKLLMLFHGGYTHAFYNAIGWEYNNVTAYDFASSYPFVMLSEKYPMEKFTDYGECTIDDILKAKDKYAFICYIALLDIEFIDHYRMPTLQHSKCVRINDAVIDSGRIIKCSYAEIYVTEMDLAILKEQYNLNPSKCIIISAEFSYKDYLPRWLTDYIFTRFELKTKLKGTDKKTEYAIEKTKINGIYGVHVQKSIQEEIKEDYDLNEYTKEKMTHEEMEEAYNKYVNSKSHYLPYQWGVWVTAYAMYNLFKLGKCCNNWIYSDTDSCYGTDWNDKKVKEYNQECKRKLKENGYHGIKHNNKVYYLGVAEFDGFYDRFKTLGAKKYCVEVDGHIKITIAGVPKGPGSKCIKKFEDFEHGFIFKGEDTGKLTHTYYGVTDIYIDEWGNETGDSINLYPCDYELSETILQEVDFDEVLKESVEVSYFG